MNASSQGPIRTELHALEAVQEALKQPHTDWGEIVIQNVDLRSLEEELSEKKLGGCQFLGCDLGPKVAKAAAESETASDPRRRCLVFPRMPWLPFNPYRHTLYQAEELLGKYTTDDVEEAKRIYASSVDWRSYATFAETNPASRDCFKPFRGDSVDTVLARRLHDTSISDALDELLDQARARHTEEKRGGIVAIMGGHDMRRQEKIAGAVPGKPLGDEEWEGMSDDAPYLKVALLAWQLTRGGYLVVSGGGPGAMEACNLGAYFATRTIQQLRSAIQLMEKASPKFEMGKSAEWILAAMKVRREFPLSSRDENQCQSVGIPTWLYGHEPPNPFATHIAKYFENSVREEGLLALASHGVVFAPGNAGTVQEIFQDACQNYYATYGTAAPMILLGVDYWDPPAMPVYVNDKRKKVFPLVRKLAEEKGFTHRVIVTDSLRAVVQNISAYKP